MLTVTCPKCHAALQVRPDSGEHLVCGACGTGINVVQPTPSAATIEPQLPATFDLPLLIAPRRPRKSGSLTRLLNIVVHTAIPAVTLYIGFRVISSRLAPEATPPAKVTKRVETLTTAPQVQQSAPSPVVAHESFAPPRREEVPPPPKAQLPQLAVDETRFANVKPYLDLPPTDSAEVVTLAQDVGDATLALFAPDESLSLVNAAVKWRPSVDGKPVTIAGLRIAGGNLEFKWTGDANVDAESTLRSSLVQLRSPSASCTVALRMPQKTSPFAMDLKKSVHRIVGLYKFPPAAECVRFELTGAAGLPPHTPEGGDLRCMKVGDEVFLRYADADRVSTRITIKKSGKAIAAVLDSRYVLPSGDVEPLAIARGNKKMKQLSALIDDATSAQASIGDLRSYYSRLESEGRRIAARRTASYVNGVLVENPIAVGQKTMGLNRITNELATTQRQIDDAERLIRDKPAMKAELASLEKVATLAQSIHGTKGIGFRFYVVANGEQVDLLVGE